MSSSPRKLSKGLSVHPGESFRSYCVRLAEDLGVSVKVLLEETRFLKARRLQVKDVVLPTEEQISNFAHATRLNQHLMRNMFLYRYQKTALNLSAYDTSVTPVASIYQKGSIYRFSQHIVCSKCVEEDLGALQLSWKLPFSFACTRHESLLVDALSMCPDRSRHVRRHRQTSIVFSDSVPASGLCGNLLEKQHRSPIAFCSQPLRTLNAVSISAMPELLRYQEVINLALSGEQVTVAGDEVSPREFFRNLRALVRLVLFTADTSILIELPRSTVASFEAAFAQIKDTFERGPVDAHRELSLHKVLRTALRDNRVVTAAVSTASWFLAAGSTAEFAARIEPAVEIARTRSGQAGLVGISRYTDTTDMLKNAILKRSFFNHTRGLFSRHASFPHEPKIPADDVPQVLGLRDYQEFFGEFHGDVASAQVNELSSRLVCSIALVKFNHNCSWKEAIEKLLIPESCTVEVKKVASIFQYSDNAKLFPERLEQLTDRLARDPQRINYGDRRRALSSFTNLNSEEWTNFRQEAVKLGVSARRTGQASHYAAMWIWIRITGGLWKYAPAFITRKEALALKNKSGQYNVGYRYRFFLKELVPSIEPLLEEYAEMVLKHHNLSGRIEA